MNVLEAHVKRWVTIIIIVKSALNNMPYKEGTDCFLTP